MGTEGLLRFFLVDGYIPAIETSPGEMISLSRAGNWRSIKAEEVLGDERSPEVTFETIAAVTARFGGSMPEGVSNTDGP